MLSRPTTRTHNWTRLKKAMLAVALLALLSLMFTRRLPGKPSAAGSGASASAGAA
jgi:hypothetical protein